MTFNIAARALRPPVPMDGGNHKGVKEIHIRATATGFEPANPSIPANTKVVLIIDARQAPACAKTMQVDPLDISAKADHHERIELTIPPQDKDAKLVLRCSMGMLKTKLRVNQ